MAGAHKKGFIAITPCGLERSKSWPKTEGDDGQFPWSCAPQGVKGNGHKPQHSMYRELSCLNRL